MNESERKGGWTEKECCVYIWGGKKPANSVGNMHAAWKLCSCPSFSCGKFHFIHINLKKLSSGKCQKVKMWMCGHRYNSWVSLHLDINFANHFLKHTASTSAISVYDIWQPLFQQKSEWLAAQSSWLRTTPTNQVKIDVWHKSNHPSD